jgi:hypothetical protein
MKAVSRIVLGLTMLALGIFLLIGIVKLTPVFGFLLIYPYVLDKILGFGLNPHLAQAIAIVAGLGICFGVFRLLSSSGTRRWIGIGILAGIWISHSLALFLLTKDSPVNPITGERKYCTYSYTTGRVEVHEQPLFDKFGRQATACTDEQVKRFELGRQFSNNENQEVNMAAVKKGFISPETGDPLFFHCNDIEGKVRFYVFPGHCPFGGMLLPVDAAVIGAAVKGLQEIEKKENERKSAAEIQRMKVEEERLRLAAVQAESDAKVKVEKERLVAETDRRKKQDDEVEKSRQEKLQAEQAKQYMANLYIFNMDWGDSGWRYWHIDFDVIEKGGVGATLNHAKLEIWNMNQCDEDPSSFRARTPKAFEWDILTPIRLEAMDHCAPQAHCYVSIDLAKYRNYLRVYG